MKDSDVRAVLEELAQGKEISAKVNTPHTYVSYLTSLPINPEGFRLFDKIYSLGEMTVFAEMELGRKLKPEGISIEDLTYRVTSEEQEACNSEIENHIRIFKERRKQEGLLTELPSGIKSWNILTDTLTGPLVEYAGDVELITGIAVRVIAQYDIEKLEELMSRPEWEPVINAVKEKYNVEITGQTTQFIEEPKPMRGGIIIPGMRMPSNPLVFKRIITKDEDLREGITAVYNAGTAVKRALDARTKELMQYV